MKGKNFAILTVTLGLIAFLVYVVVMGLPWFGGKHLLKAKDAIKYGLDLTGGVSATYIPEGNINATTDQLDAVAKIMRRRLDSKNYFDATVTTSQPNKTIIEIPNLTDPQQAIKELGNTVLLEFIDPQGQTPVAGQKFEGGQVVLSGTDIKNAKAVATQTGGWEISFEMATDEAQKRFADATERLAPTKSPIIITLSREVISAPRVQDRIDNKSAQITGSFDEKEARALAADINSGALPFNLKVVDTRYVGASLGKSALDISIKAGIIGFLLVALFMIVWYRVPGISAVIGLIAYIATLLFIFARWKTATLTLPGIAGIILSIGVAVDANVIIFERLKEELRNGKSLRAAIDAGFKRAWPAIRDANFTTIISSIVLYALGTGAIKGFALVLGMGVVLSMLSAILLVRLLVNTLYNLGVVNTRLYGFKEVK